MADSVLNLTILGPREKRVPLAIDASSTLSDLVRSLDVLLPEFKQHRIRLFHAGKVLLGDDRQNAKSLRELGIQTEAVLHLHVSEAPREPQQQQQQPAPRPSAPLPEGAIRPAPTPAEPLNALPPSESTDEEQGAPRMGFDRLRVLGLDSSQIEVIRAQFLPQVEADMGPRPDMAVQEGETEAHRLLRMEDAWMREQGPWSDFSMNLRPTLLARSNPHMRAMLENMSNSERMRLLQAMRGQDDLEQGGGNPAANAEWREARQRLGLSPINHGGTAPGLPPGLIFARRQGAAQNGDDDDDDEDEDASWRYGQATPSPQGNLSSVLSGAAIGCFFGFIVLLWVGQPSFSRQFRLGLVIGVALNIGWSITIPTLQKQGDKVKAGVGTDGTATGSGTGSGAGAGGTTAGGSGASGSGSSAGGGGGSTVPVGLPRGGTIIDG
jgi:DUF2407 C-terminal domain